jgi:hypothetical protein
MVDRSLVWDYNLYIGPVHYAVVEVESSTVAVVQDQYEPIGLIVSQLEGRLLSVFPAVKFG